jgi:hypothetical protein
MQSKACHLCDFDLKMHLYAELLIKYLHARKQKKKEDIYPLGWEASPLRCSHLNSSGLFDLSELNAESQSSDFN